VFSLKPDYEQAQKRINAFWNYEEMDRPMVCMGYRKPDATPFEPKHFATHKDYWLDIEYRAKEAAHNMSNNVYFAELMPVLMPNLGPEILSAMAGCPYHFGETTTWTDPCIFDWETDANNAVMDMNHPLAKKLEDYTKLLLTEAKGKFIVGLTDFHPGGDHLAALRDPQILALDLLDYPHEVKAKLASSYKEYFPIYDYYVDWLKREGNPIASWISITSEESMYIPSNDFSCMISPDMFEEFFLDGLIQECRHYKHNIYHLDGPDALMHLDTLLQIKELQAIQWVPGAGREEVCEWIDVYKKIQAAGKSLIVYPKRLDELLLIKEHLTSQGLCVHMLGVNNGDEAADIMKIIEKWRS